MIYLTAFPTLLKRFLALTLTLSLCLVVAHRILLLVNTLLQRSADRFASILIVGDDFAKPYKQQHMQLLQHPISSHIDKNVFRYCFAQG